MFTISQLEKYSGIKAHTIRIWEQRYEALKPNRTEGNTRFYDSDQLRRLLNITTLKEKKYKINEICNLSDKELFQTLNKEFQSTEQINNPYEIYILQLISAGLTFDEVQFSKYFDKSVKNFGLKDAYSSVLLPMFNRLGVFWTLDELPPTSEHFISNLVKTKLHAAIHELPIVTSNENTWILFLPQNELHELGLLFSNFILKNAGHKVYYLGLNVAVDVLKSAIEKLNPKNILFFMVHESTSHEVQDYLNLFYEKCPKSKIYFASKKTSSLQLNTFKNQNNITEIEQLMKIINL